MSVPVPAREMDDEPLFDPVMHTLVLPADPAGLRAVVMCF